MDRRKLIVRIVFGAIGLANVVSISVSGHVGRVNLVGIIVVGIGALLLMVME